jgi:hypothetical protein
MKDFQKEGVLALMIKNTSLSGSDMRVRRAVTHACAGNNMPWYIYLLFVTHVGKIGCGDEEPGHRKQAQSKSTSAKPYVYTWCKSIQ